MMLYSPAILHRLTGTTDAVPQMLLLYGCFLVGILPASSAWFARRLRAVLLWTFALMALGLAGVMLFAKTSPAATNLSFVVFALSYGLQSTLDFVYPNVLFPAAARASLVGAVTAVSRLGAALAAFVFPLLAEHFALEPLFCCGLVVLAAGFAAGWRGAPRDALKREAAQKP